MNTMVKRVAAVLESFPSLRSTAGSAGRSNRQPVRVRRQSSDGGNSGLRTQQSTETRTSSFRRRPTSTAHTRTARSRSSTCGTATTRVTRGVSRRRSRAAPTTRSAEPPRGLRLSIPSTNRSEFPAAGLCKLRQRLAAADLRRLATFFNPATSLFVVWRFPNDVFYSRTNGMLPGLVPGSPGGANVISNGIANILTTISTLAEAGAEHFLVPNMADLGLTPAFAGDPGSGPPEPSHRYFQPQPGGTADGP